LKEKRVLVTGGAGFIGSHLVDRLVDEGCRVVVLDDLSSGILENIRGHLDSGEVRFIEGDVRSSEVVEGAVKGVDFVCHLAAVVSVPYSMREPLLTHEVNTTGTLNLLIASLNHEVERFVYVSTCALYGEPEYLPVDEAHPTNPISPYAASKLAAEHYCKAFQQAYGLKTTILRPFNVYGPRQNDGVVAQFLQRVKQGSPPIICGNGRQTRDFVYVLDAVDAIVLALKRGSAVGEVFNVGTGKATTVNELALLFLRIFGMELKPLREEPRIGDVMESCADIRKAEKELGYRPRFSLEEALRDFVDYEAK
jgi:UDP-glucose 4-epimerase